MGESSVDKRSKPLRTETEVLKLIERECHKYGYRLFRNNSGVHREDGRYTRYGLGNRSKKFNSYMKSSDLIGFKMVGGVAVFASIECKRPGWTKPTNARERAQKRWLDAVNKCGGIGLFVTCLEDLA